MKGAANHRTPENQHLSMHHFNESGIIDRDLNIWRQNFWYSEWGLTSAVKMQNRKSFVWLERHEAVISSIVSSIKQLLRRQTSSSLPRSSSFLREREKKTSCPERVSFISSSSSEDSQKNYHWRAAPTFAALRQNHLENSAFKNNNWCWLLK